MGHWKYKETHTKELVTPFIDALALLGKVSSEIYQFLRDISNQDY